MLQDTLINALLLEDGERAGGQLGPCQQAVLPPAEVVRGGMSLLSRAVTVLFSSNLHREIFFRPLQKILFPLDCISFDWMGCTLMKSRLFII